MRPVIGAAWLFLFAGVVPAAQAGAPEVDCSRPFVFSEAGVNAAVLPYTYSGAADKPLSVAGKELSSLIYLNTLFSILKFESVGAVQLVARNPLDSRECTDSIVLDKLLGRRPGATTQIRPGNGLVMLWGRIYEEEEHIYVQSYVRFLRRDANEDVSFLTGKERFNAGLASQVITFAPQKLSSEDLDDITFEFAHSAGLRDEPDPQEPSRPMPMDMRRYDRPESRRFVNPAKNRRVVQAVRNRERSSVRRAPEGGRTADPWDSQNTSPRNLSGGRCCHIGTIQGSIRLDTGER